MARPLRVLVVEDRPADAELIVAELRHQGFAVEWSRVDTLAGVAEGLAASPDVVLSDFHLPGLTALDALARYRESGLDAPLIVVTGEVGEEAAAECIKQGATDYLLKDRLARLGTAVAQGLERSRLRRERRQAEEALRTSQAELAVLFESTPVPTLIVDSSRRVLRANRSALALAGRDSEDGFGRPVGCVIGCCNCGFDPDGCGLAPECDGCGLRLLLHATLDEGRPGRAAEVELSLASGGEARRLTFLVSTEPMETDAGRFAIVSLQDITARRAAELRVLALNRLLETIREVNQLVVREKSRDWLLAEACRVAVEQGRFAMAWVGLVDAKSGDLRPVAAAGAERGYLEAMDGPSAGDGGRTRPTLAALDVGRTVVVNDIRSQAATEAWGREALGRGYGSRVALPLPVAGKPAGVLSIFAAEPGAFDPEIVGLVEEMAADLGYALEALENAAERERGEEELRRSKAQLSDALKVARLGHWEYDVASDLFTFSDELYAVLRTTAEAVGGYTMRSADYARRFVHPDEASVVGAEIKRSVETSDPDYRGNLEHRVLFGDGTVGTIAVRFSIVKDEEGRTIRTHGANQDITERRELEAQLRHAQKMEAVGRLAGGVAHDFNNLLQAMLSQVQLLPDSLDQRDRLLEIGDELEQQVRRGAALTRQLLLFSRRETSQPVRLDLNEVLRGQGSLLKRLVRANIAFRLDLEAEPLPVEADRSQLEQVVMNLVVNASDALPEGGELVVRSGRSDGDTVWVSVEDSGPGVPAAILDKIFEPFFTTKPAGQGTGLGLSVVLGIVTQQHGRVAYRDRPGGGCVFTVTLPRSASLGEEALEVEAPAVGLPPRGQGERLLVVEDEPGARLALLKSLRSLGYQVHAAGSAEEAELLPSQPAFHLLLADLMLPGASGADLATTLRLRWPELRVVLMSGYAQDDVLGSGSGASSIRFLQKPFDLKTLARELRSALEP